MAAQSKLVSPTEDNRCFILTLPDEVLSEIFSYLDAHQKKNSISLVCKKFLVALSDPGLWKRVTVGLYIDDDIDVNYIIRGMNKRGIKGVKIGQKMCSDDKRRKYQRQQFLKFCKFTRFLASFLVKLDISNISIDLKGYLQNVQKLTQMAALKQLRVCEFPVNNNNFVKLFPNVEIFEERKVLTNKLLAHIGKHMRKIKELNLTWDWIVRENIENDEAERDEDGDHNDDLGAETIKEMMPLLKKLRLVGCSRLSDRGMEHLSELTYLEELRIKKCPKITAASVQILGNGRCKKQMKVLEIRQCEKNVYAETAISNLGCMRLTHFSITGSQVKPITDIGVEALLRACGKDLEYLRLEGEIQVSVEGLRMIAERCVNLKVLCLDRYLKVLTPENLALLHKMKSGAKIKLQEYWHL